MRSFAIASALLASASTALAGNVYVHNYCAFPTYFWEVYGNPSVVSGMKTLGANGGEFSESYIGLEDYVFKISENANANDMYDETIMQFEVSDVPSGGYVSYDLSYLDAQNSALTQKYISVYTRGTNSNTGNCISFNCPPGLEGCNQYAYTPATGTASRTWGCDRNVDIYVDFCAALHPGVAKRAQSFSA